MGWWMGGWVGGWLVKVTEESRGRDAKSESLKEKQSLVTCALIIFLSEARIEQFFPSGNGVCAI